MKPLSWTDASDLNLMLITLPLLVIVEWGIEPHHFANSFEELLIPVMKYGIYMLLHECTVRCLFSIKMFFTGNSLLGLKLFMNDKVSVLFTTWWKQLHMNHPHIILNSGIHSKIYQIDRGRLSDNTRKKAYCILLTKVWYTFMESSTYNLTYKYI